MPGATRYRIQKRRSNRRPPLLGFDSKQGRISFFCPVTPRAGEGHRVLQPNQKNAREKGG